MTSQQLAICTGARIDRAAAYLDFLLVAMLEFYINTPARQAAFLAQIGHESGGLKWLTELWGPTETQKRYEGRADLENIHPGDGYRYRGRGFIQITGRFNYAAAGKALGLDLITHPEMLAQPAAASRSAAWYWQTHDCNELADFGLFKRVTQKINGGLNGYADRCVLWEAAKEVLNVR